MTLGDGFPAVSGTVDSTELRKALAGLILRDTSGNARAGVFPAHGNALVSAKASMAVDVAAFAGCTVRGGGPIFIANDGTVAVSIDAAPVSNSRIDVVYFKQNESASPYSDANNLPVLAVGKGTAGAVPVKPTIPTGAVELATVLIPSGVSATNAGGVVITQTAPYTTVIGTALPIRSSSDLAVLTSYRTGTLATALDTGMTWRYDGSSWTRWSLPRSAYTPTLTGVTLGSGGTVAGFLSIADGYGTLEGTATLGTSPTLTDCVVSVPAAFGTSAAATADPVIDSVIFTDASAGTAGRYAGAAYALTNQYRLALVGSNGLLANATTVPGGAAWVAGDTIRWMIRFPVA